MKRLFLKPAVFVLSIFLMAGVYEGLWNMRPDYFRVQSGVNLLPLDLVQIARDYSAYSDRKPLPDLLQGQTQEAATKQIFQVYEKFRLASVLLSNEQAEYERRQKEDAQDYKIFEDSQWAQYEDFVNRKTASFRPQIQETRNQMQAILVASDVKDDEELPPGESAVQYSDLAIKLARLQLARANAEAAAREFGLHHLTDFQQKPRQRAYLGKYQEMDQLRKQIFAQQTSTDALHEQLYAAFVTYYNTSLARLRYGDFLYFSVGAATTASFGDIAPNSTLVRMLVCLQVLGSVLFCGLMISSLANRSGQMPS